MENNTNNTENTQTEDVQAENTNAETKAQGEQAQTETTEQTERTNKPNSAIAAEKYKKQRDTERERVKELEERIKAITDKGDIDEVLKALKDEKAHSEELAKQAESDRVNTSRLAQAGCVDIEVALMLLDENGDVDALKKAKPYLFKPQAGTTGFKSGNAPKNTSIDEKLDKIFKVKG